MNKKGVELSAHLYRPLDRVPAFYALFAHCFSCKDNISAVSKICTAMSQQGIAVFSLDFTGSQNEASQNQVFASGISDLVDAASFLEKNFQAPKMLLGHSLGGTAVIYAASQLDSVEAVVSIAAPAFPDQIQKLFQGKADNSGNSIVHIGGAPFRITQEFWEEIVQNPTKGMLKGMKKSLLLMHSPQDEVVGFDNALELFDQAGHPKSFISLEGADHLISDPKDSEYIGEVVAAWSKRYVPFQEDIAQHDTKGNQVFVRLSGEGFATEIKTPHHHLISDEPLEVGGTNLGPNPYDLLMAALGSCTAMTLKLYAGRKKWPLTEVSVFLNHKKIHLEDSEHSGEPGAKVSHFTRIIELEGDLDQEQRHRLLEISNRCPVHKTLQEEIVIQTLLAK
ncbi:bifunctional alpha/beta hydrolase/OsmC family protein [Algoriphagus sp. CAU 1675]|uniref:bifunctional alpha/beta hydrolase/OsmC family protein n=1 Tax=Algoriphagus sp. CAU 1675 TaxID=3032597 RepID=UPI0023DAFAA4|nr:bifunctional alpha/beta hydrolase/OsmC family protein [Algoriphagus sp. CAU 1675]MDF2158432.1 OsmC family protein [Algoriphagus sp. CAU 1675]